MKSMNILTIVGGNPHTWGIIPSFLDFNDPRPATVQFNERYIAGWHPMEGFTFDKAECTLHYPGDPVLAPLSVMHFRDEIIVMFPSEIVMVFRADGTWEVSRMD